MLKVSKNIKEQMLVNYVKKYSTIYMILTGLVAIFELCLFVRGILLFKFTSFKHYLYLISYIFLFLSSLFVIIIISIGKKKELSSKLYNFLLYFYSTAIVIWSLIISYLDMISGNVPIVYLTVIITIAGVVVLDPYYFNTILIISFVALIISDAASGFNYFESSAEYINNIIFIIMAGIISIRHFYVSYKEYKQAEILEASVLAERNRVSTISLQTIMSISNAVDAKDKYTREHSQRVAEYSKYIAEQLNWDEKKIKEIYEIALLHDIGKIGVPDSILNNSGKLTSEEYEIMKTHSTIGGDILKDLTILKNVDLGAKYHHERYDGSGYPSGLVGDNIPIEARIIAVADAFDAMNSNRIYRKRLSSDKIINELIEGKGKQFDPEIIDLFLPYASELVKKEDLNTK